MGNIMETQDEVVNVEDLTEVEWEEIRAIGWQFIVQGQFEGTTWKCWAAALIEWLGRNNREIEIIDSEEQTVIH